MNEQTAVPELPLWRQPLARSLYKTKNVPECRYLQLASIDREGYPQNRTVVFRGFDEQHRLLIITDARTEKWQELQHCKRVALCWYFATTREQYRLNGHCELLLDPEYDEFNLRGRHWDQLSTAAKKQFLWGIPKTPRQIKDSLVADKSKFEPVPTHFGLLLISVRNVDYLNLKGNPQDRVIYQKTRTRWRATPVIP